MTLDRNFRALADPTRREILRALRDRDLTAGEIAGRFSLSAPTVSHHLATLREAELVTVVREGRKLTYSLNSTVFQEFVQGLLEFMRSDGGER